MQELVERRVVWIELAPERLPPSAPPLQRALGMLLLPEDRLPVCSEAIRRQASGTDLATEIDNVIAAIPVKRFSGRTIPETCAMGGITVDDFTSSVADREIVGLGLQEGQRKGRQEGRQEGRQAEATAIALRLLHRRCGNLSPEQQARIQGLTLSALEALADALLDFQGSDDLNAWLSRHAT